MKKNGPWKIGLIGSFQKYFVDIIEIMEYFSARNIEITSPKGKNITENINRFVRLDCDNTKLSNSMIQSITFTRLFNSDLIYVVDIKGYLGNTTSYEIGRLMEKNLCILMKNQKISRLIFPMICWPGLWRRNPRSCYWMNLHDRT